MIDLLSRSLKYLDFIRSKPCAIHGCKNPIEAAHLEAVGMGRNRKRPSLRHYSAVPLCRSHHMAQEGRTSAFEALFEIKPLWRYSQQLMIEFLTGQEACWRK